MITPVTIDKSHFHISIWTNIKEKPDSLACRKWKEQDITFEIKNFIANFAIPGRYVAFIK
jgi:hypothetical protein